MFDDVGILCPKIRIFGPKKPAISNGRYFLQGTLK